MRGRAEAARRAHNPEVVRSNRAPATSKNFRIEEVFICIKLTLDNNQRKCPEKGKDQRKEQA